MHARTMHAHSHVHTRTYMSLPCAALQVVDGITNQLWKQPPIVATCLSHRQRSGAGGTAKCVANARCGDGGTDGIGDGAAQMGREEEGEKEENRVRVGDVVVMVEGRSTRSLRVRELVALIQKLPRPVLIGFKDDSRDGSKQQEKDAKLREEASFSYIIPPAWPLANTTPCTHSRTASRRSAPWPR